MTAPLFHLAPGSLDLAAVGVRLTLDGAEGHHAATVMRLGPGESIDLSDTGRIRVAGVVVAAAEGGLEIEVRTVQEHPAPHPELVLVQALAKDRRDLQAVETAVELGVDRIVPWQAERSVARWKPGREAKKHQEWVHTVRAAAKQSRRTGVPAVEALQSTAQLLDSLIEDAASTRADSNDADSTGAAETAVLVLHEEAEASLCEASRQLGLIPEPWRGPRRVLLVVGPEGGISPEERQRLTEAGAVSAVLGPHVLRTSTAGPAALSALQLLLGRWDAAPGDHSTEPTAVD
ncbi:16S rRNA (uracil(1498)-N(3))-methyltransferase [Nesterenkonia aerolata]|uniref:Ribosomal RNA small subunit methyltransferase E n=1 Tax=Nesterenkonia aerolata TaxID=3074079 RepID=A0ABU2DQ73_9MICC|nr:16S rRNA (uracil(1498)-N(3))-methyltransferase [Nesterenkonia sp. LY-0111]MDR8018649.1 16S rRNA (uracil(1498)-N(3))-methyltransferase [Nesterenkonia sp. LY-0111]